MPATAPILAYQATPAGPDAPCWERGRNSLAAVLPPAKALPRLIPVGLALALSSSALALLCWFAIAPVLRAGLAASPYGIGGPLLIATPFLWAAATSSRSIWLIARRRGGTTIDVRDGLLSVHDPSSRRGWLNVGVKDIRDIGLCAAYVSPYDSHRVLLRIERRSGVMLEYEIHTCTLAWVAPLEADLRGIVAPPRA